MPETATQETPQTTTTSTQTTPKTEERLYADKYKTPEELERGYKELKTAFDKKQKPAESREELTITPPSADDDIELDQILQRAGLKGEDLSTEWGKTGKLTESQYAALKAQGYPRSAVNALMRGQAAEAREVTTAIGSAKQEAARIAGGEPQLEVLRTWAQNGGIPPAQLAELNSVVKMRPSFYPTMIKIIAGAHAEAVGAGKAEALEAGGQSPAGTGGAKTIKEFSELRKQAEGGDAGAMQRILATDEATIKSWR